MSESKPRSDLAKKVYDSHVAFIRRVNDTFLIVRNAKPLIAPLPAKFKASKFKHLFQVPGVGGKQRSIRTPEHLTAIYKRFVEQGFFESLLITGISHFESFFLNVLTMTLQQYPKKLGAKVDGEKGERQIPLDLVLDNPTWESVIKEVVKKHLLSLSYKKPKEQIEYFNKVTGVDTSGTAFEKYLEIKATRDIIIHNGGIANEVYVDKSGTHARVESGESLTIDEEYFTSSLVILKELSAIITRGVDKNFPRRPRSRRLLTTDAEKA